MFGGSEKMIDYMHIINGFKASLALEFERFEDQQHLDGSDLDRMAVVSAQISILNSVHTALLHAENVELDRQYLAHRSRGLDGEDESVTQPMERGGDHALDFLGTGVDGWVL
jgi:hypothetical protein